MRPRPVTRLPAILPLAALLFAAGLNEAQAAPPRDWGGGGDGYELTRDEAVKHAGKSRGSVRSKGDEANGFGTLTQGVRADSYRGKRLRLRAFVKTEGVEGKAGLWMRVDGKDKGGLAFDNMMNRPVEGTTDWKAYDVVLDIPDDAGEIFFGFLVSGKGQGWVDDMTFEAVGKDVELTDLNVPPSDRQGGLNRGLSKRPKNLDFEK